MKRKNKITVPVGDLESSLDEIFSTILKGAQDEILRNPLYEFLAGKERFFTDPGTLDLELIHPFTEIIRHCVAHVHDGSDGLLLTLFTHYNFIRTNVEVICTELFGDACSHDRSGFIMKCALNWRKTGELIEFAPGKGEYENYWHPPTGSAEEWMELIEGLYELVSGKPRRYLRAFNALMQSHRAGLIEKESIQLS